MERVRYEPHTFAYTFGNRLKKKRKDKKYTQKSLAKELELPVETIRNWEQHYNLPEYQTLFRICSILDCDMDFLFGRIDKHLHEVEDICKKTGISEKTCDELIECAKARETLKKVHTNLNELSNQALDISGYIKLLKREKALQGINVIGNSGDFVPLISELLEYIQLSESPGAGALSLNDSEEYIQYKDLSDITLYPDSRIGSSTMVMLSNTLLLTDKIRQIQKILDSIIMLDNNWKELSFR